MSDADMAELKWLRFFYCEADFGPADEDVRQFIKDAYKEQGNTIPPGYADGGDAPEAA